MDQEEQKYSPQLILELVNYLDIVAAHGSEAEKSVFPTLLKIRHLLRLCVYNKNQLSGQA